VGLIGGSIGLAIKKRHLAAEVVGVFRRKSTMNKALAKKAVDRATMDLSEGVRNSDLVIVASPVYSIPGLVREAFDHAKNGAVITDVGSTKSWVAKKVAVFAKKGSQVSFVGSHPMAGSEQTGVEFARSDLMQGSPCIVTKSAVGNKKALRAVVDFWKSIGAKVSVMTAAEHDKAVALVSHLPHVVAFSLAGSVPEKFLKYAAEGFKDTTRVASSDPKLWADIFLSNRPEVLRSIRMFDKNYRSLERVLSRNDYGGLVKALLKAKTRRDKFNYGKQA
jgi:prephenate dehydrogenase